MALAPTDLKPFIPYGRHQLDEDDIAAVVDVLRKGPLTQGPKIQEFEEAVARYVGAKYAVAVANGTAALHLACLAAGLGPDSGLITSPITFLASANCALYTGASPHFSDINPASLNMDSASLSSTLRSLKGIKAIVPVHFGGLPCDMPAIQKIAKDAGALLIEDGAHALGADYLQGGKIGNGAYADMTIFSFHPVKVIASGEGGMIVTNQEPLYRQLLEWRNHGMTKDPALFKNREDAFTDGEPNPWYYEMQRLGFNYRMTDIQAALGISQLKKIDRFLARRRQIAETYDRAFEKWPFLHPAQPSGRASNAHHLYAVRIDFAALKRSRAQVMRALQAKGIGTQVHYIPVHQQPYYQKLGFKKGDYPHAEHYYKEALSLPMYAGLEDSDQQRVIEALRVVLA